MQALLTRFCCCSGLSPLFAADAAAAAEWGYSQRVVDLAEITAQKWEA
jgi:hypothetical protein